MDICDKHDDCMKELRDGQHESDKAVAKLEGVLRGFIKATESYIDASRKDLYSKGGLMDRVGNHGNQLALQWGMIGVMVVAIVVKFIKG